MCLYVKRENTLRIYILQYVDDIILTENEKKRYKKNEELKQKFDMTDLGNLKYFLGIKFERINEGMFLSQDVYLMNLLKRFRMDIQMKPMKSESSDVKEKPYRECLMYSMLNTRLNISAAVNYSYYSHST